MIERARIPWFVWTSLAAVTCILCGGYWDISWHMTIGRDSFFVQIKRAGRIETATFDAHVAP